MKKKIKWPDLVEAVKSGMLDGKSRSYADVVESVLKKWEELIGESDAKDITSSTILDFKIGLRTQLSAATVHTYLKHLRVVLIWAARHGLIHEAPHIQFDKQKDRKMMRGRAISDEEFQKIKDKLVEVFPVETWKWLRLLCCMYYGGLRIGEALSLSWDKPPFIVDLTGGRHPRFLIHGEGQKNGKDEYCPMAPDFAEWLRELLKFSPENGLVCALGITKKHASERVSEVARAAGVEATAHDFRRAFGTRWSMKVKPAVLQRMMRHSSYQTTAQFYVSLDADDIGDVLYGT